MGHWSAGSGILKIAGYTLSGFLLPWLNLTNHTDAESGCQGKNRLCLEKTLVYAGSNLCNQR